MPLHIDRVDTEIEIMRQGAGAAGAESSASPGSGGGSETMAALTGRAQLRDKLRPIVMDILNDELQRIKRKVGSP